MKYLTRVLGILIIFFFTVKLKAETWNEPWQKEIIQKSQFFIFGKVIENDGKKARITVEKKFGNEEIPNEIIIDNYFFFQLTSSSGHEIHNKLKKDVSYYFLLTKNKNNNYSLPTPTSGFAEIDENKKVSATYRHSYHQALIPQETYEMTYKNIWSYYKYKTFDNSEINKFINLQIGKKAAGFSEEEISDFYLQHAALETAYLLDLTPSIEQVFKFAKSGNFHLRVSALQLMGNYNTKQSKDFLLNSVQDKNVDNFEKVIAIWAIKKSNDKEYVQKLKLLKKNLSTEETGFGGNIMDPRVGTYFPDPRQAVEDLQ
ncbi:hypothetical protein CHRYSEOSP005_23610 [Chryseobacterium sp. Alg-005]